MMMDGENDQNNEIENESETQSIIPLTEREREGEREGEKEGEREREREREGEREERVEDLASQVLNAAAAAGKTLVDISVSAVQKTEDLIQKVTESHKQEEKEREGEREGDEREEKQYEENENDKQQVISSSSKVFQVAVSAGKTVVDMSVSAAKKTGDALQKAVETASEVIQKHKQGSEEKESNTEGEGNESIEPVSTKVLNAAATAGKTVVDLSVTAVKYTGEVINKVATSAGEVLNKDKQQSTDEDATQDIPVDGIISEQRISEQQSEGNPNPSRMWSSVRRLSEKMMQTTSTTLSKASTIVQSQPKEPEQSEEIPSQSTEPVEERSRSESIGKLWSSVRKMSMSAADHASAAIKAAEPVAISTANKVSSGAQMVWTTTKEKVLHGMNKSDETETELNQQQEIPAFTPAPSFSVSELAAEEPAKLEQFEPVTMSENNESPNEL